MGMDRNIFRAAIGDTGVKLFMEKVADFIDGLFNKVADMFTYNTNTATTGTTLAAADITGGAVEVVLNMTGTLGAGANAQLPTAAALIAALPSPVVGQSYKLKLLNGGAGAFAWTVTTNTGWTLTGTMTVAQNTEREFMVTLTAVPTTTSTAATATLQSMGVIGVTAV